jgi:outer membrane lipoprotein-sorting protein
MVAIFAGGAVAAAIRQASTASLPSRNPSSLIADVATAQLDSATGTISERADLGLPALPDNIAGESNADFTSLISGSHTLRAWFDGPTKVRVALLGALAESDVIRNGPDVWIWSSRDNTAQHVRLPERPDAGARQPAPAVTLPGVLPSGLPSQLATQLAKTPQAAAKILLAALGPSTSVTVGNTVRVAGRAAYSLIIAPKATTSLIAGIRIAIDGQRHIPLRVQVYAKHYAKPAFEIGFTQIAFERPDPSVFAFNPPPGITVKPMPKSTAPDSAQSGAAPAKPKAPAALPRVAVVGSGWTTIVVARLPEGAGVGFGSAGGAPAPSASSAPTQRPGGGVATIIKSLPTVHGAFGNGRLLETRLVTALVLDDGRIIFGAVEPSALLASASSPAVAKAAPAGPSHK